MSPEMQPSAVSTPDAPWSVAVVAGQLRDWIGRLGSVWIEGELTSWNVRGGHAYAKLRDLRDDATLSVTVWRTVLARIDGEFAQGDRVVICAKPDFWVKGGTLSMQASDVRHVGLGEVLERLERLRRQLAEEGLFDPERKRPLPFLPSKIGLITGKDSDAEKDVRRNAELRWPAVQFRTIHTAVQGERTVNEVCAALTELDADPSVDVVIVARGGGDFLHLLPFSDEQIVRTVAAMTTPVVSAIGHENDRPILDEVADLRASTPTDAAKRVVPDVAEELAGLQSVRARMTSRIVSMITTETTRIESYRSRPVLARPEVMVDREADEVGRIATRGEELVRREIDRATDRVRALSVQLRALSPQRTLDRGYALVERIDAAAASIADASPESRAVLRNAADAPAGTRLRIRLAEGVLAAASEGEQ